MILNVGDFNNSNYRITKDHLHSHHFPTYGIRRITGYHQIIEDHTDV